MRARYVVRITPEDVGSRVSVRAWLPDASDITEGPRHDDTIGTLEGWEDGWLHIRHRDGSLRQVDESLLVAGKVIPEAPPRPHRPAVS